MQRNPNFIKLRLSNQDVFFNHVRENEIYRYDTWDYSLSDVEKKAKAKGITIEKSLKRGSFKVISVPEREEKFKAETFDPELLDIDGGVV